MTANSEKKPTLFERHTATKEGFLGTLAAKSAFKAIALINSAKRAASLSAKEIATDLGVTEGRVSQVLNGDGNLHIASIARYLGACGYELQLAAVPLDPSTRPPVRTERRRRPAPPPRADHPQTWDVFEQHTISRDGVQVNFAIIHRTSGAQAEPLTKPARIGEMRLDPDGAHFNPLDASPSDWPAEIEIAEEIEDDRGAMSS